MKPLIIFKVGDAVGSLPGELGDFEHWIIDGIGPIQVSIEIIDPRRGDRLPDVENVGGAIITGSGSMVTDRAPWSEDLARWLQTAVAENVPILGICYGHQLLAHALGGEVEYHPQGIELGTVSVNLAPAAHDDALFAGFPDQFLAQAVHRQSVRRLPPRAALLAGNDFEPHHAFRVGETAWGVQFHPEFSPDVMAGYVKHLAEKLNAGSATAAELLEKVRPAEHSSSVLRVFASFAEERQARVGG